MKKMNFKTLFVFISALVLVISSCKKDEEEEKNPNQPVLNKNFSYTVVDNDVNFETQLSGIVWFTNATFGTEYYTEDGLATVRIPLAGTYKFLCTALIDGVDYESDTFNVVIGTTNTTFLESGIWKSLTGGPNGSKHWVLDTLGVLFHQPLDFYGDADYAPNDNGAWAPWGGVKITDWMAEGYTNICEGDITFNGVSGVATVNLNGETYSGIFTMKEKTRDPNFLAIPEANGGGSLWDRLINDPYNLGFISAQTADLTLTGDVRVPLDYFRATDDGQFEAADMQNVMIMSCTDSALIIRVKRSTNGGNPDPGYLLYNYIVAEYDYPEKVVPAPINTAFDATTLVGTWKLDTAQACGWVNYYDGALFNAWDSRTAMMTDFANWWSYGDPANTAHVDSMVNGLNAASELVTVTFTASSCTIHNAKFDQTTATTTETDYTAGYTVDAGVITFDSDIELSAIQVNLQGTEVHVIDPTNGSDKGIWIGQKNGDKWESSLAHLIKQP